MIESRNAMIYELIGQLLGILSALMTCLSYQANTKRRILILQCVSIVFMCISYCLLGATSGFVLNVVCLFRNIVFYFQKETSRYQLTVGIIFAVGIGMCGAFSWQGLISLLMIVALVINTVILSLGKAQILRWSILLTSTLILIYNIAMFSIGGMLNESIAILSSIVGLIRFHKKETGDA